MDIIRNHLQRSDFAVQAHASEIFPGCVSKSKKMGFCRIGLQIEAKNAGAAPPTPRLFQKAARQQSSYQIDFGAVHKLMGKPDAPENCFPVSMIPWTNFTGFNLNLTKGFDCLLPSFTMGKYSERNGRTFLPLSMQVHHAVCDGFHLSRFLREVQELIKQGLVSSR